MKNFVYSLSFVLIVVLLNSNITFSQKVLSINSSGGYTVTNYHGSSVVSVVPNSIPGEGSFPALKIQNGSPSDNPQGFTWVLKYTGPAGYDFRDVSFCDSQTGYIVTEVGSVYKSTNGGNNWSNVLAMGSPYYWYGVYALSPDTVVVAGFNDSASWIYSGMLRWTFNGGSSWSPIIRKTLGANDVGWLGGIHFFNQNVGVVFAFESGCCYYTTNGGKDAASWTEVIINSDYAWFAGDNSYGSAGSIYATGIHIAKSTNFGVTWTSGPSADAVFDGGISFIDPANIYGWTGGGEISPLVEGWTHQTTDGGITWGPRQFTTPYPIRSVKFYNQDTGICMGGDVYDTSSNRGGIYSTTNGGTNWNFDISTGAEMLSTDTKFVASDTTRYIWVVGMLPNSYAGVCYEAIARNLVGIKQVSSEVPKAFTLYQNYPNPFNPTTVIKFSIPAGDAYMRPVQLRIYDILGREVANLVNQNLNPGSYEINFNAANLTSGVYFYKLTAGNIVEVKKMMLIK